MRPTARIGATAATLAVTGALLLLVAPPPADLVGELARTLRNPVLAVDRGGPDEVLLTVTAAAAWLVLGWLGCTLALVALGAVPGVAGRMARGVARRIVPATVRRLLTTALGVGLAVGAGTATAPAAWAGPGTDVAITAPTAWAGPGTDVAITAPTARAGSGAVPVAAGSGETPPVGDWSGPIPPHPPAAVPTPWAGPIPPALDLDWPAVAPTRTAGPSPGTSDRGPTAADTPRPTGPPEAGTPPETPPETGTPVRAGTRGTAPTRRPTDGPRPHEHGQHGEHRTTVTVRSGDSLWAIADRQLGPGAGTREVAAAWPRWWAANRTTIGADPNVIHPGQRLTAPGSDHLTGSTP